MVEKTDKKEVVPKAETKKPAKKTNAKKSTKKAPKKEAGKFNIGIDVKDPEGTCTDKFCPFHGTLPVRGQILEGHVVSDKMQKTAVVKRDYMRKDQKYERLEKRSNKYVVHNPPCLGIEIGDNVKIMECRPLSKLVSFVIIEKM
jgi:small subunit ribosomal protein S17